MKKRLLSVLLASGMVATTLVGCSIGGSGNKKVGVAMPTKDLQRWNQDGANMEQLLKEAGYDVDLQYASNDINTQVTQIENMISSGCDVLVIASIDGDSLGTVLEQAKQKKIPVIAYDRLIMNSDAVTYYATFDNYMVGTKQGQYIEEQLGLKEGKGGYNMEIFTGDPGDNNARFFYGGAMDVLILTSKQVRSQFLQDRSISIQLLQLTGHQMQHRLEWKLSFLPTTLTEQSLTQFSAQTTLQHSVLQTHS